MIFILSLFSVNSPIIPRRVPAFNFLSIIPSLWTPITFEFDAKIIGDPEKPLSVSQLCKNSLSDIETIFPGAHSMSLPKGYPKVNTFSYR